MNMKNECREIYVNTEDRGGIVYRDVEDPVKNRNDYYDAVISSSAPLVTIFFLAYNNLEKYTKPALDALLRYTAHIDIELVLIDNGSADNTLTYFQNVPFKRKQIVRVTKNLGAVFGNLAAESAIGQMNLGKYIVSLPNDIIVTQNWLDNLLRCMESDERIGMAVPVSNYVSYDEDVDLHFTDMNDMQRRAAIYNVSDERKWEERIKLIPTTMIIRRCLWLMYVYDPAFFYFCADDDMAFQYRRWGYRLILCRDTFVYHGGSLGRNEDGYEERVMQSLRIFAAKYQGIDPWEGTHNLEQRRCDVLLKPYISAAVKKATAYKLLGVDVRCGAPLLTVKNILRRNGKNDISISAYTHDAKYYVDLATVCNDGVYSYNLPQNNQFDGIILGELLNIYDDPWQLLKIFLPMLKKQGRCVMKFNNYTLKDNEAVFFEDLRKFLIKYPRYHIKENFIYPVKIKEYEEYYACLYKKMQLNDDAAKKQLQELFPDSLVKGELCMGEITVVIEKI